MWVKSNNSNFYNGGRPAVEFFNQAITERRNSVPFVNKLKYQKEVHELREKGYVKWSQVIDHEKIDKINQQVSALISENKNLKLHDEHYAMVSDPFLHSNESFQIATSDLLVDFATEYFECAPGIGTFNLRRSFLNSHPPKSTQYYHCDKNSIKFFKFFVYLNDVDDVSHGPLTLIKGSGDKRPISFGMKHRWTDEEIQNLYGKDSPVFLTAKKGDLIAATTTFFHKGTKPTTKERTMLTINYGVHPELAGGRPGDYEKLFKVREDQYKSLPNNKRHVCDFLERC